MLQDIAALGVIAASMLMLLLAIHSIEERPSRAGPVWWLWRLAAFAGGVALPTALATLDANYRDSMEIGMGVGLLLYGLISMGRRYDLPDITAFDLLAVFSGIGLFIAGMAS